MAQPGIQPQPPEAEGAAAYRKLMAGGFSQDEADQWKAQQTARLSAGGFKPDEIDKYWGGTTPPTAAADANARATLGSLSPDQQSHVAENPMEMFSAGWQNSDLGLILNGKAPTTVAPEHAGMFSNLMETLGQTIGDLPAMIIGQQGGTAAGAAAGAAVPGAGETGISEAVGGVIGGGAGGAALPQAIRETLLASYNRGEIHNFGDFWNTFSGALIRTMKAATIGGIMGPAGEAAGGLVGKVTANAAVRTGANLTTQAVTGTAVGGALDGRVPNSSDFVTAAVLMLGLHAGHVVGGKFMPSEAAQRVATNFQRIFAERGIPPWEAAQRAQTDPVWRQEAMAQDTHGDPVHPTINRESPPEPKPYHQPPEPPDKSGWRANGQNVEWVNADGQHPQPDVPPPNADHLPPEKGFTTNPMRIQDEHDADMSAIHRGAHVAVNVESMLPLFRSLEGSGDAAISPAGAVGRYQIMPGTARQYGFDPAKLTDPAYNEMVARHVLTDLFHRYNGNVDDIEVAYNAGPGRANKWIADGRRVSDLPTETQRYLAHSDKINGWDRPEEGAGGGAEPPAGGKPPAGRAEGGEGAGGAEIPPDRLSKDSLEDIMHDLVGEPKPPASVWNIDTMYRQYVSELGPARSMDNLLAAEGMTKPGDTRINTEDMFRQTYGSAQRAGHFVRYGVLDPLAVDEKGMPLIGKKSDDSFVKAYQLAMEAGGDARGFDAYRIAKRTVEKAGQGIRTGIDVMRAQALVNKTEKIYGPASKMMNVVKDGALDYARDSGVFSPEQTAIIKQYNEHHVTFRRIMGDEEAPLQARGRGFRASNPVRQMKGGDAKIMDPLTADIDNLHTMIKMADRNRAIGHVIGAIEAHEGLAEQLGFKKLSGPDTKAMLAEPGNVFKPYNIADKDQKAYDPFIAARAFRGEKNGDKFVFFRNGKPEVWQATDPDFAQLMRGADAKPQMDFFTKTATFIAKMQRAGITIGPDYASRITARHQLTAAIFDRNGGIPFSDVFHGITKAVSADEHYQRWVANGGAGTALVDMDINYIKRDFSDIMEKTGTQNRLWNIVRHPVQFSQLISERMDAGARTGYMLRTENQLGSLKAATGGRKAYLDYTERGTSAVAGWMAQVTPFMRPHIIGVKQAYEGFTERPLQTSMKAAMYITLPTMALYWLNYMQDKYGGLPDDQKYENLPRWQKDTLFIAPSIAGVRLRLMTPPIVGPIFGGMMNRFLDYMVKEDPHAFEDWGKSVLAEFIPPVIPQIALPITEALSNHSFFSGKPLIPASMEDNSGPMQYTENTTAPAKALSRILGSQGLNITDSVSPIVIENFVKEWAGTGGMAALKVLNAPFSDNGAPWSVADIPFVQSFVIRNPGMNAEPIQNFYDDLAKFRTAHADLATAMDRAGVTGDISELKGRVDNPDAYVNMISVAHALKMQHQAIIAINHNDKMTDDEKRQFIDNAYSSMITTAKFGMQMMDAIDKGRSNGSP